MKSNINRHFIVEVNAGNNFKPAVYFQNAKSHFEISELVYFSKGQSATMDDLDRLIQKLPCGTRDTGKDSPLDKESYFQEDCLVAMAKGHSIDLLINTLKEAGKNAKR